jgi:acyl-CoA synthetase (AMP-forming)/AMP-acid ligase II
MLWSVPDYEKYDLSSLKFALYAGSAVDVPFLERLSQMAPQFGTGLGMTENAGFATLLLPASPSSKWPAKQAVPSPT